MLREFKAADCGAAMQVVARGFRIAARRDALTQFPDSALAAMVRWCQGNGTQTASDATSSSSLHLDFSPNVVVVLVQWLSARYLFMPDARRGHGVAPSLGETTQHKKLVLQAATCPNRNGATIGQGHGNGDATDMEGSSHDAQQAGSDASCVDDPDSSNDRATSSRSSSYSGSDSIWANASIGSPPSSPGPSPIVAAAAVVTAVAPVPVHAPRYDTLSYDWLPPPPQLPPALQREFDELLDYVGLTAAVYGSLPHVYGVSVPAVLRRHDAAPAFCYRSHPAALVLDGPWLRLGSRGYAHASAPLLSLPPAHAPHAGAIADDGGKAGVRHGGFEAASACLAGSGHGKLLWKVRLWHVDEPTNPQYGSSGGNSNNSSSNSTGGCGYHGQGRPTGLPRCRPDTSLGVLVVRVEEGGDCTAASGSGAPPSPPAAASLPPIIPAAVAAAWGGPLPLLAAAPPHVRASSAAAAAAAAAAASSFFGATAAGAGSSTLHLPGFFGWHIAGLAKGYGSGVTRVQAQGSCVCSPNGNEPGHAGPAATAASSSEGHCPTCQQPFPVGQGGADGSGVGCSGGMFFAHSDVLLFGLDPASCRLEMHHSRLRRTFSVALPPAAAPAAAARAGCRMVLYAHVCMYDKGEGLEQLELSLRDLQVMGCV